VPKRFAVQLNADQFDRLARPTLPVAGVAEMIWNALDAEADEVFVAIERTELDAVAAVSVSDNGHGMDHRDAEEGFAELGGSWKKDREKSRNDLRALHGREGAGRFRAFAIGRNVEWVSTVRGADGRLERTRITGSMDNSEFMVSDSEEVDSGDPGTEVVITRPREMVGRLLSDVAVPWLISQLAVYLLKYPEVKVHYDGTVMDPTTIILNEIEMDLDAPAGAAGSSPSLKIIEWHPSAKGIRPSMVLCGPEGTALEELTEGIEAPPDLRYTAYVSWQGFADHAGDLLLGDLAHPAISPVLKSAREEISDYLEQRLNARRAAVIDRWKASRVYPYAGDATTPIEVEERKVFDVVAAAAASAVSSDVKSAKLSLRLIKEALAQPPGALHRVLSEVLELTPEQLADFDRLLDRTSLASLIHTSKTVTDRLDFLHDLEGMLFDTDKSDQLLERSQLHRILASRGTWIFGESFSLAVDDQGLTKVLEAHREVIGDATPVTEPVTDTEGHTRRIDLMFWKAAHESDRRRHLVVELKRPKVVLGQPELNQVTKYAVAINRDQRFKSPDVTWDFWLLGDDMDEIVEELVNKKDSEPGLYTDSGSYRIWVRRWAEVLEENRQRLHFFRDRLSYVEPTDRAELDAVVDKYLIQDVATPG
jgi:hypothetical protein